MKRSFLVVLVLLLALLALPGLAESIPLDEEGPQDAVIVTGRSKETTGAMTSRRCRPVCGSCCTITAL